MDIEKSWEDFPALRQKINGKKIIYFDNACTALRPRQVIEKMLEYFEKYPGCVGRSAHKFGTMATEKFNESRAAVARFVGADEKEIIFTKNTTESLNLVANSIGLKKNDVVVASDREHNSNLVPWLLLSERIGIKHSVISSKKDETFDLNAFAQGMSRNVKVVSIVHSSNIDGYTLPVKDIAKISHDYGALVVLDGAQSVPHKKMDVKRLDIDFLAFSGHKMLGPSCGVLYGKYHLLEKLDAFMVGGDTVKNTTYRSFELLKPPERFEAGLQDYAGIIGLSAAIEYLNKIGLDKVEAHEVELNKIINKSVLDTGVAEIVGVKDAALRGGITSFNIKGIGNHDIAMMLDQSNIMIRSGYHCCHSWFNARKIDGSARVSLYLYNTKEEAKVFAENIQKISMLAK
ncbi:MAG: aminotransferase class V-fold PLP-dependent enzyme [Candidatus Aenigmatarchaeota archaeon]